MAGLLRRVLITLNAPLSSRSSVALRNLAVNSQCCNPETLTGEEGSCLEDQARPAFAPCSDEPSTSYTLTCAASPFRLHRTSFHRAAFQPAADAASVDSSSVSVAAPAPVGPPIWAGDAAMGVEAGGRNISKDGLWKGRPIKQLTIGLKRIGGRNSTGQITVWHRGGGHKRLYRVIDFKRQGPLVSDVPATVQRIERDPNRNAHIALIRYSSGHLSYILAPEGLRVGDSVCAGQQVDIKTGNALPLGNIPRGTVVHNIEMTPGRGGQLVRSAGTSAQVIGQVQRYSQVRLQSGEMRMILATCMATVGSVSNANYHNINWGKAGKSRWLGWRPTVRGVAMNPVDHPHGGGEGKTSGGRTSSMSPWAKPAKGGKTRNKKKPSSKLIMTRRKKASAR